MQSYSLARSKSHILGQGCPICRYDVISEKRRIPLEQILQRCKEVHGERWGYDWKGNEYKNTNSKLPINCEEHGIFFQSVQKHLAGQGCPSCAVNVGYDPSKPGYYYVHEILNSDGDVLYYKGGISGDWERRLSELSSGLRNRCQFTMYRLFISRMARMQRNRVQDTYNCQRYQRKSATKKF